MLGTWRNDQSISVEQQITTLGAALKNIGKADIARFLKDFPTLSIKTNAPWKETKTARATGNWDGPRHQVAAIIESCDGVLEQVNQGSVTFVVRIMSREGLDKLWRMYTSGELAKKLTELLITEELTTEDESNLDIQATIPKNDYDQACGFFDELKNQRKEFPTVSVETNASLKGTETARATGNLRMDIVVSNDWEGQDYRRHQVSAVLESCDGVLEQGNPGSGTFVVRIMSREGLDKLWRMYTTGDFAKKLTKIIIMDELTTEDKSDLAIQATIPENDYDQACGFFDELEKDQRKDEEDSSGMMDVEQKELGESSPAKTGYSSDPAEQSAERSAEKLEILHTTTEGALYYEAITSYTMDKKPAGSTRASKSEALTGNLSNLKLPTSEGASSRPYLDSRGHCDPGRSDRLRKDARRAYRDDSLLFDPREYPVEDRSKLLESFLETSAPSKVNRSEGIGWIRVLSPSIEATKKMNIKGLQADWEQLKKSEKDINFEAVLKLATSYKYFSGNWNLFPDTGDEIDSVWEKIARATVRDELGTHAMVTPCKDTEEGKAVYATSQGQHVINVYIKDFTDKEDVMKVEAKLRKLGCRERMVFKPNVYSKLGIYSHNQWGLRPSIYTSKWDRRRLAGSIQDCTKSPVTYMINDQ